MIGGTFYVYSVNHDEAGYDKSITKKNGLETSGGEGGRDEIFHNTTREM